MSDITGAIVALIALKSSGIADKFISKKTFKTEGTGWEILTKPVMGEITPPTSEAGVRPQCAIGEKAKFNVQTDSWQCVPAGWD